jgi:CRISPR-associated endonuclease/helicase Cas3
MASKQLHKAAFTAGCWHDIGKLEVHFQDWLNKELKKKDLNTELPENGVHIDGGKGFANFSWEKYPTHNEVSTLVYELLAKTMFGRSEEKAIKHAIYWHHAKPIRKDEINSLTQVLGKLKDNKLKKLLDQSQRIMQSVDNLTNNYFEIKLIKIKQASNYEDEIDGIKLPEYKTYENTADNIESYQKQITKNSKENLIRAAVITADRLISSLSSYKLKNYIDNKELENFAKEQLIQERGLNQHIKTCLDSFDNMENSDKDRNAQQKQVSGKLADKEIEIAVLKGPAGYNITLKMRLCIQFKQLFFTVCFIFISVFKFTRVNFYCCIW